MKKWIGWGLVVGLVVFSGIWGVSRLLPTSDTALIGAVKARATPVVLSGPASMQATLMDPAVDLAGRETLMEKIEIRKRVDDNEKAGQSKPGDKTSPVQAAPQAVMAASQVETGIFEGSEGMIRPEQAAIQNYWRGVVDGKVIMLMAGASAQDPNQGLVVRIEASLDPADNSIQFEFFNSPRKDGSLRVSEVKGNLVTLQAPGGAILQFDLQKRTFGE